MTRSERLHAITEHLRRRRTATTVAELAERFAVDVRTIHRDLAALRDQSVPIEGEPGRGGGLRLAPGHVMPPLGLSVDEAVGLWISWRLAALLPPSPAGATLGAAVDKVLAAVPEPRRTRVAGILRRVVIGKPPRPGLVAEAGPVDRDVLATCERAFLASSRLRLEYVNRHGVATSPEVEPHGLLVQAPLWYLLAVDRRSGHAKSYRFDRVRRAVALGGRGFEPRDPRLLFEEIGGLAIELPMPRT